VFFAGWKILLGIDANDLIDLLLKRLRPVLAGRGANEGDMSLPASSIALTK
jgi:hypothetical protein